MRNRRDNGRILFEHTRNVRIMARDGSWQRPCVMKDVSNSGARLRIEGSLDGLDLKDFYLALAPFGRAYRRCEMVWHRGDLLGVRFHKPRIVDISADQVPAQAAAAVAHRR